jgi:hypothetical protein
VPEQGGDTLICMYDNEGADAVQRKQIRHWIFTRMLLRPIAG